MKLLYTYDYLNRIMTYVGIMGIMLVPWNVPVEMETMEVGKVKVLIVGIIVPKILINSAR